MPQPFDLSGKTALVFGASNPVGRAIAVVLAEAGADVAVATTLPTQKETVLANSCANEVWALDRRGFAAAIDASQSEEIDKLVQRTVAELGGINILVNALRLPSPDGPEPSWRQVIDTILSAVYHACRTAGETMAAQGEGRIINVVSLLAKYPLLGAQAHCAAEAGVLNLTRAFALEWADKGVTVNLIAAGLPEQAPRPEEVASTAVYLASEAAASLTGQAIWL